MSVSVCRYGIWQRTKPVDVVIRPEDMEFLEKGKGIMDGVVTSILFKGVHYEMKVQATWL